MTISSFAIHVFYPDGEQPETGEQQLSALSDQWLSICVDLLDRNGPVMDHNMGSTLSHFDIKLGGTVGQLCAFGQTCFEFAMTSGRNPEQDRATTAHFAEVLRRVSADGGGPLSTVLRRAQQAPTVLMFDACPPEVDDGQKSALMRLGLHLAGAYFHCGAAPRHSPLM